MILSKKNSDWDFDSPNSYDYDLLLETVTKLKQGKTVDVPIYDFETHKRYIFEEQLQWLAYSRQG